MGSDKNYSTLQTEHLDPQNEDLSLFNDICDFSLSIQSRITPPFILGLESKKYKNHVLA